MKTMEKETDKGLARKTATNNNPLGIFDSGVGGVSVLQWLRRILPHEDLIYIADKGYAPYGNRPSPYVEDRAITLTRFLLEKNAKAVVIACNTATVTSIATLRSMFPVPFIGIEPGVKPAMAATSSGVIGVLATTETLKSPSFHKLIQRFGKEVRIEVQECPGLMEQVESMEFTTPRTRELLENYLNPLLKRGADTIVLGCTHYPFLTPMIREIAGERIRIIETGEAVSRQVLRSLTNMGLMSDRKSIGSASFWTTGSCDVETVLSTMWEESVKVKKIP